MAQKIYTNGGVKYFFDKTEEGKLVLQSIKIFGKEFMFPNGGIPEKEVEEISSAIEEKITQSNEDGDINRVEEIANFLRGYPEGTLLEDVLNDLAGTTNLTDEEMTSWFDNKVTGGTGE